ncbi:Transglutaminase-like enzyme, putative cysteine protease [Roseomonas rosea]|uniref:Transglutaminase-like enzyme, putative cysteine protease n=1 Tax=Muricoccus roseus TaxID=198092 RepID=A0A1M6A985_9PROT|nr:transglutaminase family protein [Roseomonas rosea]SHI33022.1 Transglutaminase-like enzyme, putative cysteine protease [Roseomonas rosea]
MPILTVRHVTTYHYRQPVSFGEHRMMLRPRAGHDQRLLKARIDITPEPSQVWWVHDVFGNSVGVVNFTTRARELRFASRIILDHRPLEELDFRLEDHARSLPFSYSAEEMPDLARSIERHHPDPSRVVDRWARGFLSRTGPTGTLELLTAMAHAVSRDFTYVPRAMRGIQEPVRTLELGSGTCRDFALLMMEAVRSLGLAARYVSGYIYSPGFDRALREGRAHVGGGSTHAWVRVYLPGAGWVEFDPTNGIVGNRDLIRVAIARDPAQAVPLHGSWKGFPDDALDMDVSVTVTAEDEPVPARGPAQQNA